ncbi:hypothetical protein SAMN05444354_121103 [Stigmatella aurantiaca]|uniref:Uncharacterized protein n=1 Tax=Stigmatella aurantiaca TaxID=41 RepID=A0A1H8AJT4_STIAU|nr:hypothetical protein [Stigmatella aurantiaca]SEM71042.1 hypothetical protein SAMN05444354_121103 [Stigmatella aurantiaca]
MLALAVSASAEAQEPDTLPWPVQALFLQDVAQVQEAGAVQAQAAFQARDTPGGTYLEVPFEAEFGLGHHLQLTSALHWEREPTEEALQRGISSVAVGATYGLIDSAARGLALSSGLEASFSRAAFSDNQWTLAARFLAFQQVGWLGLSADLEPGVAHARHQPLKPRAELGLGVVLGSGWICPVGEVHAELEAERTLELSGGVKVKPGPAVELGAGALIGKHGTENILGALASIVISYPP